jgi:cell surface protein SprA
VKPVFEVRGQILGIWLSSPAKDDDVIAVSYDIVDVGTGEVVRRVGRSSEDGEDGRIIDPNDPRRTINYFKLLKPGGPTSQPFSRLLSDYTEFALTWEYEYRNCYDLRGREIDAEQLVFRIVSSDATLDPPDRTPADIDPTRTPFVRVFGLDRQARTGVLKPDGLADIEDQGVFNLRAGFVRFPHVTPMDLPDEVVEEYTGGALPSLPGSMRAPAIYTRRLTAAESAALNGFYFEIEWRE